jgi:hypothetical protein
MKGDEEYDFRGENVVETMLFISIQERKSLNTLKNARLGKRATSRNAKIRQKFVNFPKISFGSAFQGCETYKHPLESQNRKSELQKTVSEGGH